MDTWTLLAISLCAAFTHLGVALVTAGLVARRASRAAWSQGWRQRGRLERYR